MTPSGPGSDVRACYVLLRYPVLSETFVRDEVDALRAAGASVMTISMEGEAGADVALGARRARSWWAMRGILACLRRRPAAIGVLARGPLTLGLRVKALAAAGAAARAGATAVHAHFVYRNADLAELVGRALGTGHSVTVHARDVFVPNGDVDRRLRVARRVVTVCDYNQRFLEEHHGPAVAGRLRVIPCSVEVDDEPPASRAGRPTVLAIGRLVPKKGFDVLLAAAAELRAEADVVVIGDGPEAAALSDQAEALGLGDRVRFLGALDHDATLEWFGRASVLAQPFRVAADGDRDSMPVVVKEAMAAGVPVVATDVVGVPEMVDHGRTGLLVPPDDPGALAAALDQLLADPAAAQAMGRAGHALARARFDIRDQALQVLEVLR